MSKLVPVTPAETHQETSADDHLPVVGQWYWVKKEELRPGHIDHEGDDVERSGSRLMLCNHLGSNHATFVVTDGTYGGLNGNTVMDVEMHTRLCHEPGWREIIQARIETLQLELKEAVKRLSDQCMDADLIQDGSAETETNPMALVVGSDPVAKKEALVELRDTHIPAVTKAVDVITKEVVGQYKNLFLADQVRAKALIHAAAGVEDKLFALELYAGFDEHMTQIADGAPAPMETPITIRQMLRYMDEETLIAAEDGGMDFSDIGKFDKWLKDNVDQVMPEPRCVVAFQIRRNMKDYGRCNDIGTALMHLRWHDKNTLTYLIVRNGERLYRINSELDFTPRLIAFREEFDRPLEVKDTWSQKIKKITPKDYEYDDEIEGREKKMKQYNRILFIIQGLLDRSKVFEPHPRISLAKMEDVQHWIVANHDEEDGLPSSSPPSWEEYQGRCNKLLKPGCIVYAIFEHMRNRRSWRERESDLWEKWSCYLRVESISRDKAKIKLSMPADPRSGWQYPKRQYYMEGGKQYYGHGNWGDWPVNKRNHVETKITNVFNCDAYLPGEYKRFLCDAHAKGVYLKWAPFLLKAERYHKMTAEEKTKL